MSELVLAAINANSKDYAPHGSSRGYTVQSSAHSQMACRAADHHNVLQKGMAQRNLYYQNQDRETGLIV